MEKTKLILVGGGGHGKVLLDLILKNDTHEVLGYTDISDNGPLLGVPYLGTDDQIKPYSEEGASFLVVIGQIKNHVQRENAFKHIQKHKGILINFFSPLAYVSYSAKLGIGNCFLNFSNIGAEVTIGDNCIINTNATIEHESIIGNNVHISTSATVNGQCKIGDNVFLGSNAVVNQGITIVDNCIIGAGAVIHKNITESGIYYGNPYSKK